MAILELADMVKFVDSSSGQIGSERSYLSNIRLRWMVPESKYKTLYENALKENERLNSTLAELQKNLQTALDGNNELLQQMKILQEKLDVLLAKKKNRDRQQFDTKNEGRNNPRPAPPATPEIDRRQRNDNDVPEVSPDYSDYKLEPVEHLVPENERICPHCNVETKFLGTTVTHQLESLLQSLKWLEHRQETRSCRKCKNYIITAPKPPQPIPGGYAGPNLLATIIVDKLDDGLPNYRQQKRFKRLSIPVARSTQSDWMIATSLTVSPLYELINREILKSEIVQTDESPIKVQDRKLRKNIRKAKLFVCRGDKQHRLVSFTYSPDLSFEKNKEFFKGYTGTIQADAANGFDALFRPDDDGKCATEAGCHAHGRRKIFDARTMSLEIADKMLDIYKELYLIERRAKRLNSATRLALRRRYSKPLLRKLRSMHVKNQKTLSPTNLLCVAAGYALRHWKSLTRFLKNPEIEIDNNASERAIKDLVLARKNFLFAGSDAGAEAIAIHLTLIASAKRNGHNPVEYLADVFSRINEMKTSELSQLLPDRWQKAKC